jgi:glucose-6-phosphate isomerase
MSISAVRWGNVTWDWSHLVTVKKTDPKRYEEVWERLKFRYAREVGFFHAPFDSELSQLEACESLAVDFLQKETITDCLFVGIGGSFLGPKSLLFALEERYKSPIKWHFLENPDPCIWKSTLEVLQPEKTLVCIVTKSGTTYETLAETLLILSWLGKQRWKDHLVFITDPQEGELRRFARDHQISTLSIAPSIGGRFSIFSPVGLFPAALAGLSPRAFLQGANLIRSLMESPHYEKNPLFCIGDSLLQQFPKRPIHVCMPYSSRLEFFSKWFAQLWSESLGKKGLGFTPVVALGAVDQHSLIQLLSDGPDDKVTFFLKVDQMDDLLIPKIAEVSSMLYPTFQMLGGCTLHELLKIENQATSTVLFRKGRPSFSITIDRLDEQSLGSLYFSFCALVSWIGTFWGIDPFDQPGVQEGKELIRKTLMQKQGS